MMKDSAAWLGFPGARHIGDDERRALGAVLDRRVLYRGGGPGEAVEVAEAEAELATRLGRRHALMLNSGTSALLAAFVGLGLGPGDEVVIPSYGWLSVVTTLAHLGAVPVFAPLTRGLVLDTSRLDRCLSSATRAILPLHPCGQPCPLPAGPSEGPAIVEDACQALGSFDAHGRPMGGPGPLASVFSFQAYKIVSAGEGGALVTDDEALYRRALAFHDAGLERFAAGGSTQVEPRGLGLNLRMSELAAALVRVQLGRLDAVIAAQRAQQSRLSEAFAPLVDAGLVELVEPAAGRHTNGTFVVVEAASASLARALTTHLRERGIGALLANDRPYHALPGWRRYVRANTIPHRVVEPERSLAVLERTLLLEVNVELPEAALRGLARATHDFRNQGALP